jgi:hypothetical protein
MEKPSESQCVGSVPFDYSFTEDSGRAPDVGSAVPQSDLNETTGSSISQIEDPAERQNKQINYNDTKLTPLLLPLEDGATPIPGCKGLLNRKEVRATALRLINERFPATNGGRMFSRVSDKFIDRLEIAVQAEMVAAIQRHPSPFVSPTVREFPWTQKTIQNSNTPHTPPLL